MGGGGAVQRKLTLVSDRGNWPWCQRSKKARGSRSTQDNFTATKWCRFFFFSPTAVFSSWQRGSRQMFPVLLLLLCFSPLSTTDPNSTFFTGGAARGFLLLLSWCWCWSWSWSWSWVTRRVSSSLLVCLHLHFLPYNRFLRCFSFSLCRLLSPCARDWPGHTSAVGQPKWIY